MYIINKEKYNIKEGVPLPIKRWNVKGLWRGEIFSTFLLKGENMVEAKKFGFYTINAEYLKFLHDQDSEVYYNSKYHKFKKPFVGIIVGLGES